MPSLWSRLGLIVLILTLSAPAWALELSADVVRRGKGQEQTSKVFIKNDKIRLEGMPSPGGGQGYNILRTDKKVIWLVQPERKTYIELPLGHLTDMSQQAVTGGKLPGEATRRELGQEKIDGRPTTKYEVIYSVAGQNYMIHQWLDRELKLPLKTADTDGAWSVEYRNLRLGPQADALFELPADYQVISLPALIQGLGGGQTPASPASPPPSQPTATSGGGR